MDKESLVGRIGMGGLQRGWLAAAASRARPLEADEKVCKRGAVV